MMNKRWLVPWGVTSVKMNAKQFSTAFISLEVLHFFRVGNTAVNHFIHMASSTYRLC